MHEEDGGLTHLARIDDLEAEPGVISRGGYVDLDPVNLALFAVEGRDRVIEVLPVVGIRQRIREQGTGFSFTPPCSAILFAAPVHLFIRKDVMRWPTFMLERIPLGTMHR